MAEHEKPDKYSIKHDGSDVKEQRRRGGDDTSLPSARRVSWGEDPLPGPLARRPVSDKLHYVNYASVALIRLTLNSERGLS